MAELNAKYPSAGSVYHWSAMLAPKRHADLAAYACGVINLAGNAAGDAAFAFGFANFVDSASIASGGGALSDGGVVGLAMFVCTVWAGINALRVEQQGWVNNVAAVWQCGAVVLMIALVLGVPQRDPGVPSDWIWRTPFSTTGYSGQDGRYSGYVYLLGLLNALFAFSGYEAGTHMAEETKGSSAASSWGIIHCCLLTFAIGLVFNMGLLYATPTATLVTYAQWVAGGGLNTTVAGGGGGGAAAAAAAAAEDPYVPAGDTSLGAFLGHAMYLTREGGSIAVFFSAAGQGGGAFLSLLLIVSSFFTGVASLTATSRICYAMARDNALPWSGGLTYIWPATASPMGTVLATLVMDYALLMLGLASSEGLTAVLSITVIGFQLSYAMPLVLRLTSARHTFKAHPDFDLGGWSLPLHTIGSVWLIFTSLILLWPTAFPVEGGNMNYTVLVVGGVGLWGAGWWVAKARFVFQGPRGKTEAVEGLGREGAAAGPCALSEEGVQGEGVGVVGEEGGDKNTHLNTL
jgi:amino acid transporter